MLWLFPYQGNPKPLKRQVHRKLTGFYPKTRVFEFPNFPLVHFPIKSCLWCSKINNVVISMLPVVLCRAGLETLLGNCSYISQMHALNLSFDENAPTNNVNFCIPGAYTTTWIVYLQIFPDEQATRFLMKFVCAKTISGPKTLLWQPTGQTPKTHNFFTGSHGLITCFFTGFLKAGVLFKIRKYEFSTG